MHKNNLLGEPNTIRNKRTNKQTNHTFLYPRETHPMRTNYPTIPLSHEYVRTIHEAI